MNPDSESDPPHLIRALIAIVVISLMIDGLLRSC